MIKVSDSFKQNNKLSMRLPVKQRLTINIENSTFKNNGVVVCSDVDDMAMFNNVNTPQSMPEKIQLILKHKEVADKYATLEFNSYKLGRARELFHTSTALGNEQMFYGLISKSLSDESGNIRFVCDIKAKDELTNQDIVTTIANFSINFGDKISFPEEFTLTFYNNITVVKKYEIKNNTSSKFTLGEEVRDITSVRIFVSKMNLKLSRVRIHDVFFGEKFVYEDEKIISSTKKETINPLFNEIPEYNLNFQIYDDDELFNPENPKSFVKYIQYGANVTNEYIFNDEVIKCGTYYIAKTPEIDGKYVTFNCDGLFQTLSNKSRVTKYSTPKVITKETAIKELYKELGIDEYVKYSSKALTELSQEMVANDFSSRNTNELIQLILSSCNLIQTTTADGYLYIKENEKYSVDYKLPLDLIIGYPKFICTENPQIKNIIFNNYTLDGTNNQIISTPLTYNFDNTGVDVTINNEFNGKNSYDVDSNIVYKWLNDIRKYEITYRGDISLEVGDIIKIDTQYQTDVEVMILSNEFNYPSNAGAKMVVIEMR